ncbi:MULTISPECIES: CBS domain-containing protein [unclassified Streptomyces]|uniref:CBS domain-containing protein n=1 Tax=unclassified Streptomyces TaxID=2593676 RepID=UPI002E1E41A6|nr:CBS domain-containing protein [Streptomyces sp. NBC_01023]
MDHRRISELMTRDVVSVRTDTPFKEIARTLAEHDVSAVPVLDRAGRPAGIVSEADLLREAADRSDLSGRTPLPRLEAWERARAEGHNAEEVMSAPAVCAHQDWTVVEAARLMAVHHVKRLPVVDETDTPLGLVARADLLRVFLRQDRAIHEEIVHDVLTTTLGFAPSDVTVEVTDGQVLLRGTVDDSSLVPVLIRLCTSVDGVVSVSERLSYRTAPVRAGNGAMS